jgi:hypothetical protein
MAEATTTHEQIDWKEGSHEMLMAFRPQLLPKVIEGLEMLSKAGLRYPIPNYGLQMDPSEGLAVSYSETGKK